MSFDYQPPSMGIRAWCEDTVQALADGVAGSAARARQRLLRTVAHGTLKGAPP